MELQFYGTNCLRISTKKAQIVVDDNLEKLGLKSITKPTDICLHTFKDVPSHECHFEADMPGEYEISGVVIHGIAARAHMDEEGKKSATIYTIAADEMKIAVLGHIHPDLSEDQLEAIGLVDIAIVPVGNSGYTLDGVGALQVIKKIEPKIVIPTHYADKVVKYEVPQVELAEALKNLAMEPTETVDKYRPKPTDLTDTTHLIVLNRQ
ncbi:MAG TPA: MBL fold metallo-hydrolase [Candidatus Saccharimonadales bacterium]|nr:MBL fold metallo-hydrolase [Candidatus Saccharimonadales bacterium]